MKLLIFADNCKNIGNQPLLYTLVSYVCIDDHKTKYEYDNKNISLNYLVEQNVWVCNIWSALFLFIFSENVAQ